MEGKLEIVWRSVANGQREISCECDFTGTNKERDMAFDMVCSCLKIGIEELASAIVRRSRCGDQFDKLFSQGIISHGEG